MTSKAAIKVQDKLAAIDQLRETLKPGDTVYTTVESVARSGMSRNIKAFIKTETGIRNIGYLVARILELPLRDSGSVHISGCGMDMGWALVYDLSYKLFSKETGDRGGYALKQSWL